MTTLALADVTPVPLEGEPPSDKAFRADDSMQVYRVRLVEAEAIPPDFSATGGVAPIVQAFDLTLTRLIGGEVERDPAGRLIMAAHCRLTIDETTRAREGFTMAGEVDRTIRHLIHQAECRRISDADTASYLASEWAVQAPAA